MSFGGEYGPDGEDLIEPKTAFIEAPDAEERAVLHAQVLYMNYTPITKIARVTGLKVTQITNRAYTKGGWQDQREALQKEINEEIKQNALTQLKKINHISLELIQSALLKLKEDCEREETALTLGQAAVVSEIWKNIHKAKVMEENRDNDNEGLSITPEEVLKAITSDPYLRYALPEPGDVDLPDSEIHTITATEIVDKVLDRKDGSDTDSENV